jgi:hypothetical protein
MKREYHFMNVFSYEDINVQSLMFKCNGDFNTFTCPRNITLGRAIAMWNFYNVGFPPFDFLMANGKKSLGI